MQLTHTKKSERGEGSILGLIFALGIIAVLVALAMWTINEASERQRAKDAAQQTIQLRRAVGGYLKGNINTVRTAVIAGPIAVSLADLRSGGYLQPTFPNTNPFMATYATCISLDAAGLLQTLVTATGGSPMYERHAPTFASWVGSGNGGWMDYTIANRVRGSWGSIDLDIGGLSPTCAIAGPGHEASLDWYDPSSLGGDPLQVVEVRPVVHDELVDKPTCPGAWVPRIQLAQSTSAGTDPAEVIAAEQPYADNASATQWRIQYRVLTETGWHNPSGTIAQLLATIMCGP